MEGIEEYGLQRVCIQCHWGQVRVLCCLLCGNDLTPMARHLFLIRMCVCLRGSIPVYIQGSVCIGSDLVTCCLVFLLLAATGSGAHHISADD